MHPALVVAARTAVIALLLLPLFPSPTAANQDRDESLVCQFDASVEDYVQLHRRLERFVPPQVVTADPYLLFISRYALAAEIRRARPLARQGEVFTPEIAAMFRRIVARSLREDEIDMTVFLAEDGMTLPIDVRVNGDYPLGGPVTTMPPSLLKALPALPPELQYRFVNFNLILWDVHAALIVDFVPDVFRRTTVP